MNKLLILKAYFLANIRKKWSRKKIQKHHKKRLKKICGFASSHSSYYANVHSGKSSFRELPIISKKEMMDNFSLFNTKGIDKETAFQFAVEEESLRKFSSNFDGITVGLSSGTSGNRGIFLVSEKERFSWCGNVFAKTLPSSIWKKHSVALFLRANSTLYETVKSNRINFTFYDLQEPFEKLYEKYVKHNPQTIVAPPSVLRILAKQKEKTNDPTTPRKIISCAETLDPIDEKYLSKIFKQPIFQIYQCTEGFLAFTCSENTLHINEDLIYLEKEYIDESTNRFIPIITDLYRTTQPIIRYRLDDVLVEKKGKCRCGSHYLSLEFIEGRCDDVLYFFNINQKLIPIFPDFIRRKIIATSEKIQDYQIIQKSPGLVHLYLDPIIPEVVIEIQKYLRERGLILPNIKIIDHAIKRPQEKKLRRIQREFDV